VGFGIPGIPEFLEFRNSEESVGGGFRNSRILLQMASCFCIERGEQLRDALAQVPTWRIILDMSYNTHIIAKQNVADYWRDIIDWIDRTEADVALSKILGRLEHMELHGLKFDIICHCKANCKPRTEFHWFKYEADRDAFFKKYMERLVRAIIARRDS